MAAGHDRYKKQQLTTVFTDYTDDSLGMCVVQRPHPVGEELNHPNS